MNPLFHTEFSISDSLKNVRKSVLIYETIIAGLILKNKDTRAMNLIIRYQKLNFVQKEALCNILDTLTEKE